LPRRKEKRILSNRVYYTKREYREGGGSIGVAAADRGGEESNCGIYLRT
jgi:hypothetical protein